MKKMKPMMGTVITIEIADPSAREADNDEVFAYFEQVEERFSVFKETSEISRINSGEISPDDFSEEMREIFILAEKTKEDTDGYFDIIANDGRYNPSGIVKGWSINNAAKILRKKGYKNFYVDAGGDIEASGKNAEGRPWSVGIKNPFDQFEIVKVVYLEKGGIATSGTYIRGQHIYNPFLRNNAITDIVSMSVIGPDIYEADRFATAAFSMGRNGIMFIEKLPGFEGYMIDKDGLATYTTGFDKFTENRYVQDHR